MIDRGEQFTPAPNLPLEIPLDSANGSLDLDAYSGWPIPAGHEAYDSRGLPYDDRYPERADKPGYQGPIINNDQARAFGGWNRE